MNWIIYLSIHGRYLTLDFRDFTFPVPIPLEAPEVPPEEDNEPDPLCFLLEGPAPNQFVNISAMSGSWLWSNIKIKNLMLYPILQYGLYVGRYP